MRKLAYLLGISLLAVSCQKVIDVDLNEANENIVIEANYTGEDSTVRVHVSMTSSYFNSDPSPVVDDALVTITDANGVSTNVPSIGNGDYELSNYVPQYGTNYTLVVSNQGNNYTAVCDMPQPVALEPISYEYFEGFFGSEGGYAAFLNFNDPAGVENYYVAVLGENGVVYDSTNQVFTQDDALTDGNFIQRPLFASDFFAIGDTVFMELRTVDKAIYDYTNEVQSIAGGGGGGGDSAAPGNPTTNWDNYALGYFNAYGISQDTVVIQ